MSIRDKSKNNKEYQAIVKNIINSEDFIKLQQISHHDNNRYDHSLKVSYYSYLITKKLHLNYKSTARGGLLHDFYFERTSDVKNSKEKIKIFTYGHPATALDNARKYFDINDIETNIIRSHMFPVDYILPKYAESWVVSLVDKGVATHEFSRKFKYKLEYSLALSFIFFINWFLR